MVAAPSGGAATITHSLSGVFSARIILRRLVRAAARSSLGDRPNSARSYATAAASRPGTTYARIIALDLVAQAEQQAKQGGIEQACTTWSRAIDTMAGVRSTRTLKAVRSLRSDLRPYRARGVQCVAELDERARLFLASHPN
ncbi:hypothetical protein [Streptomyces bluensis]|uniref:hypothetical protein n=1 Tax=Streptomyces bluensis TaxID=33897 RepID=UPI001672E8A1|nr:hypothetical protein [Streptomyces bluensis]